MKLSEPRRPEDIGFWCGFAVFCAIGFGLYLAREFLAQKIGLTAADTVTAVPGFFAIFIIPRVRNIYVRLAMKRYCVQVGHDLCEYDSLKGEPVVQCKRCSLTVIGPPETERLARIKADPRLRRLAERLDESGRVRKNR